MSLRQRHIGLRFALGGVLLICALTLMPTPEESGRAAATPLYCILCGDAGGVDFFLNILLFVPLGLGLVLAGVSWRRAVVLGALLSCGVELLQMKAIAGRDASIGDILANSTGAGVGALLASRWRHLVHPAPPVARRLAVSWGLALCLAWSGTAWALKPNLRTRGQWFGASAPELDNFDQFLGRPLAVTAGREPLLTGPLLDQAELTESLASQAEMGFRAIIAGPTRGLAPIGLIVDDLEGDVLILGQQGEDLAFELRMRATLLKLRNPRVSLANGLAGAPGDTIDAAGVLRDGVFDLSSRNGARIHTRRLPLSASWGWDLVVPWDPVLGGDVYLLTALWIAGLLALLGYWGALGGAVTTGLSPVTAGVLLGVVPWVSGFPPAHWSEWAAAGGGILAGTLLARILQARSGIRLGTENERGSVTQSETTR